MSQLTPGDSQHPQSRWALFSRAMFGCVVALFLCSLLVFAMAALDWVHRPFPGFIVLESMRVDRGGSAHWSGSLAGLRFPDEVQAVNEQPVHSVKEILDIVSGVPIGTALRYSIRRGDEGFSVPVHTMMFTWSDAIIKFGVMFLIGGCIFTLGIVVFLVKPHTEVSWVFCLAGFLYALDVMNVYDYMDDPMGMTRLVYIGAVLFPSTVVHLAALFPGQSPWFQRYRFLLVIPYGFSLYLAVGMEWLYRDQPFYDTLHHWFVSYLALSALLLLVKIAVDWWGSRSVLTRARAKVLLLGAALALPIPAGAAVLRSFGASLGGVPTSFTVLPLLVFPAAIAFAIAKHNLFDVDTYIKQTVGYVMMTAVVAGGYFAMQTVVKTTVLDPLVGQSSEHVYPLIFALIIVFAFDPLRRKVQVGVDKLFFRKGYDYKATVAAVSESLSTLVDIQTFIERVIHTVRTDLFVDRAGVILWDDRSQTCQSLFRGGKFGRKDDPAADSEDLCLLPQDPLLNLLTHERKLITKYDVAEDPRYRAVRESCGQRFEDLGASMALPLFYRDQFAGVLALGYKKSGRFYSREDVDLLGTLSSMTSTAIEQSREKGQKAVLMQLFSKHVSPQVAESLWEQREQFLEGGRPKSQSMVVTAMFTDLQGFSTLSEKQSPEILMGWLNTYLEMMTTTVMEYGGVVDDFFGDGVKINFGVPVPRETEAEVRQDAVNAVSCALAMEQRMIALNEKMAAQDQQALRMRIGIFTGPVVAGSLGSAERMKYTTIGDTVNTAARLESFDKDLVIAHVSDSPCRILIGESTLRQVESRFEVEKVGELSLKGKSERVGAYCVIGRINELSPVQESEAHGGLFN